MTFAFLSLLATSFFFALSALLCFAIDSGDINQIDCNKYWQRDFDISDRIATVSPKLKVSRVYPIHINLSSGATETAKKQIASQIMHCRRYITSFL